MEGKFKFNPLIWDKLAKCTNADKNDKMPSQRLNDVHRRPSNSVSRPSNSHIPVPYNYIPSDAQSTQSVESRIVGRLANEIDKMILDDLLNGSERGTKNKK